MKDLVNCLSFIASPWREIVFAFLFSLVLYSSVLIIGFVFGKLEQMLYKMFSKFVGQKLADIICNRVTVVGVVIHEYAHALFAFIFGAKVHKIRVFDIFKGNQLGHVEFSVRGNRLQKDVQLVFTSCAPVIAGLFVLYLSAFVLLPRAVMWWQYVLLGYLIVAMICHISMSDVDIKNYLRGLVFVFPFTVFVMFGVTRLFFVY
jgi:hypothetical protein